MASPFISPPPPSFITRLGCDTLNQSSSDLDPLSQSAYSATNIERLLKKHHSLLESLSPPVQPANVDDSKDLNLTHEGDEYRSLCKRLQSHLQSGGVRLPPSLAPPLPPIPEGSDSSLACTTEGLRALAVLLDPSTNEQRSAILEVVALGRKTGDANKPNAVPDQEVHPRAFKVLAGLGRRQNRLGAFNLMVELGVWTRHENLTLLRSSFPVRFSKEEEAAAVAAERTQLDPDAAVGLRRDLRKLKVYTIDSASTSEIDDGLSVEVIPGSPHRTRYWIHIADADRWAPRSSDLIKAAKRRSTSLYIPTGSFPMFPSWVSAGCMSLTAQRDAVALSLGVELDEDGAILLDSIRLTPSLVRVAYRLSYDDVDEMLEEGVGYREEWQLGALLAAANKRRQYRRSNGSSESMISTPVPIGSISVKPDRLCEDGCNVQLSVDVSHNAGSNQTALNPNPSYREAVSVSSSNLLVTEMMILAGEALARWANEKPDLPLPYRGQAAPEFMTRQVETQMLRDLREGNIGGGLCAAWYARRFFEPVAISETPIRHAGLGLDMYVQWSSPIRRFGDLQVHAAVKRYLRRERVKEMLAAGVPIPEGIDATALGVHLCGVDDDFLGDRDSIDFNEGAALFREGRKVQKESQKYWMYEYIRRITIGRDGDKKRTFQAVVLGGITKGVYAIFIPELGLEHSFRSDRGELQIGERFCCKIMDVDPRRSILLIQSVS